MSFSRSGQPPHSLRIPSKSSVHAAITHPASTVTLRKKDDRMAILCNDLGSAPVSVPRVAIHLHGGNGRVDDDRHKPHNPRVPYALPNLTFSYNHECVSTPVVLESWEAHAERPEAKQRIPCIETFAGYARRLSCLTRGAETDVTHRVVVIEECLGAVCASEPPGSRHDMVSGCHRSCGQRTHRQRM